MLAVCVSFQHLYSSLENVEPSLLKESSYIISNLLQQFDVWFKDFKASELPIIFQRFSTPFAVEIDSLAEEWGLIAIQFEA